MAQVVTGHCDDPRGVQEVAEAFGALHPGYHLGYALVDADDHYVAPAAGGARILWLDRGSAEAWLAGGHRTNEGDGTALPPAYVPDPLSPADHQALHTLKAALGQAHPGAAAALGAILERYDGSVYRGGFAGEVWKLLETGLSQDAWLASGEGRSSIAHLVSRIGDLGWATKRGAGSFERFTPGDQLLATAEAPLRVRGTFGYWWMELPVGSRPPGSTTRRLRYLRDTAGGCAPGFTAFRRLTLPWQPFTGTSTRPDGVNVVNSHAVHITAAQSRTHYHPIPAIGGGSAQSEFYFVLDCADLGLQHPGTPSVLHIFPDVGDWSIFDVVALRPGSVVLIPPGTGHRGVDALVNVVTVPGFKPGNEIYVDAVIAEQTRGKGVFNAAYAAPTPPMTSSPEARAAQAAF